MEHGEEEVVRVEKDFQLVLHKISEVSQAEGPDCLNGDFVKVWNKPFSRNMYTGGLKTPS